MEPMTESAILNIPELVSSGTQIFEIESDDNELETSDQPEKKTSPLLPMPDPTKISLPLSRENSGTSFELSESETLTSERQTNLPLSQNLARCANEISSAFDAANILPEGVGQTCQNVYTIGLEHFALERLTSFYTVFSAFAAASTYYAPRPLSVVAPLKSSKLSIPRLHRDSLPPEPLNY